MAKLNRNDGSILVSLLKPGSNRPASIEIAFIGKDSKTTTFELAAAGQPGGPGSVYQGSNPRWLKNSFVGIEIKIPISRVKTETIRLSPAE